MHKNKYNSKEKILCSLDLGWIYLFCHCQRQATCATGCRGLHLTSWDWDMPPHFGIGSCKQTSMVYSKGRGEGRKEKALTNGSGTSTSWSIASACLSLQRPEQQLRGVGGSGKRTPAARCAARCLCLRGQNHGEEISLTWCYHHLTHNSSEYLVGMVL